jgi:glycosyltransferase involved in cell wall biosynthesis
MPTRDRRKYVSQAIWYFLRQDYGNAELIVVDDGEDAVADLVPHDKHIRYTRLDRRLPLGAKRNFACQLSQGELIAHWDDDDWIAPHRISAQVNRLLAAGADVCGVSDILHFRLGAGDAWSYHPIDSARPWIAGGTMVYRRAVWATHRYAETMDGDDRAFLQHVPAERIEAMADTSFYVALLHPGNTIARNLADPCWRRRPLHDVTARLAPDRDFYAALRNGRTADVGVRPPPEPVTIVGQFMVYDGYGSMAEYLVLGMERCGARVQVAAIRCDPAGLSEELQAIMQRSHPRPADLTLCFCWPRENLARFRDARDLFINTMWETSKLPSGWADLLNQARAVIVPSRFVAAVFRASGVTVPIEVVPQGVDPAVYHYEARPERPGLTTLTVGTFVPRKNIEIGISAWKHAFPDDPGARLIIKSRFKVRPYVPDDPRIVFVDSEEPTHGIAHWYRQADVLLALGNEGFGLPLVEGMATGLPVVALDSEGQADICADAAGLILSVRPTRWQEFAEAPFGPCGVRGIPAVEEVAARLCWVADHRSEAQAMGQAASQWALRHRDIWAMGPAMLDVMERYSQPARPLRRCDTLWIDDRQAQRVGSYATELAAALPAARVVTAAPDVRAVQLLHIQHDDGCWNDVELTEHVQRCRFAGVPVVITEHSVGANARPWERDATVLAALTTTDAEHLRARWPGKRVELLPPGCPAWFPPVKAVKGRVIGVFASPIALRELRELIGQRYLPTGAALLLFGPAPAGAKEALMARDGEVVAVRQLDAALCGAELAVELAQCADVLVFWSDGPVAPAIHCAALAGLASGVPVIASAAGFPDLRDVTYQPATLKEGIANVLDDASLCTGLRIAARTYCHERSWRRIAEIHLALWRTLQSAM